MIKRKIIWILSIVSIITLINCGGGSSKEAKELLQRILNLVGIPQEIVLNICQNSNNNNICENYELQAKISINKSDNLNTILSKITKTSEGRYLLETLDTTKPILLILKDIVNVKYDNGEFSFHFNGLKENELEKELSIFQTMIDAQYLTVENVKKIRNLNSDKTQDAFYKMLLKTLEENLNTLRDRLSEPNVSPESSTISQIKSRIEAEQAMRDDLIDMSQNLLKNGIESEIPQKLNSCNGETSCVKTILDNLANNLKITPQRAKDIYPVVIENNNSSTDSNNSLSNNLPFSVPDNAFVTLWKTTNRGTSNSNQITIPTSGNGYNYSVDWGDGTHDSNLTTSKTHTYDSGGEYTISIFGKFPRIAFGKDSDGNMETIENDARKLISIVKWGDNVWSSMEGAFMECTSLEGEPSDKPNLSKVNTVKSMFYGATSFNNSSIKDWDMSNITNMNSMFAYAYTFNQDISGWNVSKVTDMSNMFKEAKSFDQDLGNWKIENVRYMKGMFEGIKLSTENYDSILVNWNATHHQANVQFNAGDSVYSCDGKDARDDLTHLWGWLIFDGGSNSDYCSNNNDYREYPY